ncbi:hypothetical protein BDR22DRAFT_186290 [Usnea florida]
MQPHTTPLILALLLSLTAAAIATAIPPPHHLLHKPVPPTTTPHLLPRLYPSPPQKRASIYRIKDLPDGYTGIFTTFTSLTPDLPATVRFIRFFKTAAAYAAKDPVLGRHHQRFTFGSLALELVVREADGVVSREFVQAACLWLLDAARKGWVGFFRAWVKDLVDQEVIEITMGTIFDLPADDNLAVEP